MKTKYEIGDTVYFASTQSETKQHPCPDCKGSGKWKAISPAGGEYEFSCPRCSSRYQSNSELSLNYISKIPIIGERTIGSIRTDTFDDRPITYMCVETGIGSGSIYHENDLYPDKESAEKAAQVKAHCIIATDRFLKAYDDSIKLSDYQLSNALMESAKDKRISAEVSVQMLFENLRECQDTNEVRAIMDDFNWD